jgi:hypothetical protein
MESAVPQPRSAVGNAVPLARRASTEPAVPQASPAVGSWRSLGAPAVPQARRASTEPAVPQPRSAVVGGGAARRAKCAAATGASTSTRPEALLVLLNPRRTGRLVGTAGHEPATIRKSREIYSWETHHEYEI